ncbi:TolC family protein [Prevotella sp. OH937_COT-195]|uniref:TolC family protein n=1 Tax=Prevotella sp. OH937_COT-195 TaxID=2491051 RepID=UPI000F64900B|nr:TolC family protein [Prevotella sp. OH937_COT-195]RRD02908.1 transporter [Prevotella sp. OH937_COT-195]
MMKNALILFLTACCLPVCAQLTIDEALERARANYPYIKQYALLEQSRDFTLSNVAKGWLPQVSVSGRATYQSDVTRLPIDAKMFGAEYEGLSRYQYDTHIMVSQTIYDGGTIATGKGVGTAYNDVLREQINVTMYGIRERVTQLFFGILLIDVQLDRNELLQDDLRLGLKTVESMFAAGIANRTDVDAVMVEQIRARQQKATLHTMRQTYSRMLSTFTGIPIDDLARLQKPDDTLVTLGNNRPELLLYDAKQRLLDARRRSLDASLRPRVGVFLQGGFGNPGLNMLKKGWDAYYKVGATVSWNIGAIYTWKNNCRLIEMERWQAETERATFLFNHRMQEQHANGLIENLRKQIVMDDEIIRLRENIRSNSEKRVRGGIETVNEMLRDINAVSEARLQRDIHEVKMLQAVYELKTINNN